MKLSEKDLQNYVCTLLELDGWTVRALEQNYSERKRKLVGEKGMPDLLVIRYRWTECLIEGDLTGFKLVELMWIELKTPTGKPSKAQIAWHAAERKRGALTLIAGLDFTATQEGFYNWYRDSWLMRKAISPPKGATM